MKKNKTIKGKNKQEKFQAKTKERRIFLYFVFFALLAFIALILFRMSHQAKKQNGINEEISNFQIQINRLEGENKDLNELIGYLKTDDFKEKEAKDKLNLIKEGEQMVLVKEDSLKEELRLKTVEKETEFIVRRENYYYWWHYFFSIK